MTRRRAVWTGAVLGAVGVGAVVALAASALLGPHADSGMDVETPPTAGIIVSGEGTRQIELVGMPDDTTHLAVTFGCDSVGTYRWGPDAAGPDALVSAESECRRYQLGTAARFTPFDFVLPEPPASFTVAAAPDDVWSLSIRWLADRAVVDGVNAAGETYGTAGVAGEPPALVRVPALDRDGVAITGYARSNELDPSLPASEAETLRLEMERDARYPDGRPVAVYDIDGQTVIGSFTVRAG